MRQGTGTHDAAKDAGAPSRLVIEWAAERNEEGGPTRWFGSWLMGGGDIEGGWFYGGHGGQRTEHTVPDGAVGVRVRKWTSEGLDPEYVDVPLDGEGPLRTGDLDFDGPRPGRMDRAPNGQG